MEVRVMTARTVEEAIELALKELDADRDEAEVEILSRGKSGFLGIGAELARVRVTKIAQGASAASIAVDALSNILQAANVNVSRTLRSANDPDVGGPIIDLSGEDSGLLIGRRGQTLQALQFLVNIIVRQRMGESVRVMLDVERYRERRGLRCGIWPPRSPQGSCRPTAALPSNPCHPPTGGWCTQRWPTTQESPQKAQGRGTIAR